MSHTCYRQKRVKMPIPITQQRVWVQNLNKGDRVTMPPGCATMEEPVLLPDDLFQRYEHMPISFKRLPFAFAVDHPKQEDIQKILNYSFKQQRDEDVAYCSGFVCSVIKSCLNAIEVPCSLEIGYRKMEKDSSPHTWLNIDDIKVDNTYEKYMTKHQISCFEKSTPKCYQQNTFSYPRNDKMPTDKDEFSQICFKKGLEMFFRDSNKGLALGLNQESLYMYYFSMIRFMWESFKVNISGIHPAIRHQCWGCGVFPSHSRELLTDILPNGYKEVKTESHESHQKFKHCSQCMVANYCSSKCQENDWVDQHRFTCVSRATGSSSDFYNGT